MGTVIFVWNRDSIKRFQVGLGGKYAKYRFK